jgi:arginase
LAVKIVRQARQIALLGVPTSAAAPAAGSERAPQALRAAGLTARLTSAGFAVTDYGDCTTRTFATDDEHPRTRNVAQILAGIEELRPMVEVAVKSGALPVVIGGDDSIVLGTIAGARRYFPNVGLLYADRDAGLNVPATTPSGCVDGMVISHVIGRGAPELVRFWGEPPLVREPDVALFGTARWDPPEEQFVSRSPLRRYTADDISRKGAAASAEDALDRIHGRQHPFVLHIDLDVIAAEDFPATNLSAPGGLRLDEVRHALAVVARQPTLAALEISAYNPALDADGSAAQRLIDLLVEILAPRLTESAAGESVAANAAVPAPVTASASAPVSVASSTEDVAPEPDTSSAPEPDASSAPQPDTPSSPEIDPSDSGATSS